MLKALGNVYKRALRQVLYALLALIFSYIGSEHGAVGVAVGVLLAAFINALMMLQLFLYETKNSWVEAIGFIFYGYRFALVVSLPVFLLDMLISQYGFPVIIELLILVCIWILSVTVVVKYMSNVVFKGI